MSDGGAQFFHMFLGVNNAGFNIAFKEAGESTGKHIWTDEGKTNPVFQIQADSHGMATWYADGNYDMIITTNSDDLLYTLSNVRMTSDTATMWEGNFGTTLPTATEKNRNQLFALIDTSNVFQSLYINTGTIPAFVAIAGPFMVSSLTDLIGAEGYTPSIPQIQFDATDIDAVRDFGVPTNGDDASVPLTNALNAWKALAYPGVFDFPTRKSITISTAVSIDYSANDGKVKIVNGNGCKIINGLASGTCLEFKTSGGVFVSNFDIRNILMQQSANANTSTCFRFAGGDGWMNRNELSHIYIQGFGSGIGLLIDNVGETVLSHIKAYGPIGSLASPITSGVGVKLANTDTNTNYLTNAIVFHGLRTEGGLYGVDMPADTDTQFFGIGIWSAYSYGMRASSAFRGSIYGAHFENNYRQADSVAAGAHLRLNNCKGTVVLSGISGGTVAPSGIAYYAKYIMDIDIAGATGFSNTVTIIGGNQGTKHQDGSYYYGDFGTTGESKVVVLGQKISHTYDGNADVFKLDGWALNVPYNLRKSHNLGGGINGTIAIELDNGGFQLGIMADSAVITIAKPTSGFYGGLIPNGAPITIQLRQGAVAGTVAFDTAYKGASAAGTTNNSFSSWTFRYNGGNWILDTETINVY